MDTTSGFICYSLADKAMCDEFRTHLSALEASYGIAFWADLSLRGGDTFDTIIKSQIATADLFLLLISENWFASNYIRNTELPAIFDRYDKARAPIVPVILRSCAWQALLGSFQAVPKDKSGVRPIRNWRSRHDGYAEATEQIRLVLVDRMNLAPRCLGLGNDGANADRPSSQGLTTPATAPDDFSPEEVVARILAGRPIPAAWVPFVTRLDLAFSNLSDTVSLRGLLAVESLDIQNTPVSDLAPIVSLTSLEFLNVRNTRIRDIAPIAGFPALKHLMAGDTFVRDVAAIASLSSLQILDLAGTWVTDLSPLKGLHKLESLNLAGTPVDNISALAGLTALRELSLQATKVVDVSPLAAHRSLRTLRIDGAQVRDVAALRPLMQGGLRIIRE
jgi:Leucine-rich repeat (LRR) protein